MAGAGGARGGLGWLILVVALAVPGVLFYNWWSHLKAEREKTVAVKTRGRAPDGGMFQSSPNARLVNPMTGSMTAATAPVALSTDAAPVAARVEPAPVAVSPADEVRSSTFSISAAASPLKRDPTLSPFDRFRINEAEEAKLKAARDIAEMNRPRKPRRNRTADPKTLVELQGIISNTESGYKAIVNSEVFGAGEFVGRTKIKIVKITDLGVTFDFQGMRFSKSVSRD